VSDRAAALADFGRCVAAWGALTAQRALAQPRDLVGTRLRFADGTTSVVFRETALRDVPTSPPVLLVIAFRLAFLGSRPALHAAFRRECVLHTPLFAGFPGFRSKLWADDVGTGIYRGVYGWQDAGLATHYAERMVGLLAPFSTPASARFHVADGLTREEYLRGTEPAAPADAWWRLAGPPSR
jgi:hypothetical protein